MGEEVFIKGQELAEVCKKDEMRLGYHELARFQAGEELPEVLTNHCQRGKFEDEQELGNPG